MMDATEGGLSEPLLSQDFKHTKETIPLDTAYATLASGNPNGAPKMSEMYFENQEPQDPNTPNRGSNKPNPTTPGVSGPLSNSFFAPTGGEIDLERQIGNYSLCYRKLAVYTSDKNKLYILAGSQDFSNEHFEVLIVHGFRSKDTSPNVFRFEEDRISIKRGDKDRKVEFLEHLRKHFDDSSISFSFKSFGLAGLMKFEQVYHAIFVKEISQTGKLLQHEIFQATDWKVLTLYSNDKELEEKSFQAIKRYLESETNKSFFYSFTYDLTHNMQDNFSYSLKQNDPLKKKFENPEFPLFRWNDLQSRTFQKMLKDVSSDKWVIRLMHGYYEEMTVDLFSNVLSVHIISRRLIQAAGTRYNKRGLNDDGFAGNFVETEQVVTNLTLSSKIKPMVSSFVQVRGSVPMYWYQNAAYFITKPPIIINKEVDPDRISSRKHFSDLIGLYGKNIFCLNLMKSRLLKKSNNEEKLSEEFKTLVAKIRTSEKNFESIDYKHIDLKNLIKEDQDNFFSQAFKLAEDLTRKFEYFKLSGFDSRCASGEVLIQYQNGINRINCVDCLDRTNFMMNIIAETAFIKQIKEMLQMKPNDKLDLATKIVQTYQSIWRNNGDSIALQYGGSRAHQQKDSNSIEVVMESVKRHFSNSFKDEKKQELMSIWLGEFQINLPNRGTFSEPKTPKDRKTSASKEADQSTDNVYNGTRDPEAMMLDSDIRGVNDTTVGTIGRARDRTHKNSDANLGSTGASPTQQQSIQSVSSRQWSKLTNQFEPSPAVKNIATEHSTNLLGRYYRDFQQKLTIETGRQVSHTAYLLSIQTLSRLSVEKPFMAVLLKPKLFENRKNLISELTEKQIIKGLSQKNAEQKEESDEESEEDIVPGGKKTEDRGSIGGGAGALDGGPSGLAACGKGRREYKGEAEEKEKRWTEKIKESREFYQQDVFGKFLQLDEGLADGAEIQYEDTKNSFYSAAVHGTKPSEYLYDITGKDILTEELFLTYDAFSLVGCVILPLTLE